VLLDIILIPCQDEYMAAQAHVMMNNVQDVQDCDDMRLIDFALRPAAHMQHQI
jgi:hypothetical protein